MSRKAQSAKGAYSGGAKSKPARKPKAAPRSARKPADAKKAKPVVLACSDGIEAPRVKHAGGRPTKYDPAYCEKVIEWGRAGKSREWIAGTLMVIPETMREWEKVHPEFSAAITLAKTLELIWWEDAGQEHLTTTGFSASAWSRSMAARFPSKWREQKQVDHGVTDSLSDLMSQLDGRTPRIPSHVTA